MAPQQEGKLERRIDPFLLLVQSSSSSDDALDAILFSSMLLLFSDRTKGTNGSSILQWEELKMSFLGETIGPDQFVMSSSFHSSTHSQMIIVIISSFFHHQSPRQFH